MHYIDPLPKTVRVRLTVMAELVKQTVVDPLAINNLQTVYYKLLFTDSRTTRQAKSDPCNFLSTRQTVRPC